MFVLTLLVLLVLISKIMTFAVVKNKIIYCLLLCLSV